MHCSPTNTLKSVLLTYSNINAGVLDCTHRQTQSHTWRDVQLQLTDYTDKWNRITFIGWLYCTLDRLQQSVTLTSTMADVCWKIDMRFNQLAMRQHSRYYITNSSTSCCRVQFMSHLTCYGIFQETLFQQWQRTEGGWASHPDKRHHNTKYEHEQINLSTATAWTQWHEAKSDRPNL